jgi:hypothetical protein
MLAYLDTFIGFAVVMLGVSLIITILTQIASSLFAHRGTTLRWGLSVLLKQMDPKATPVISARSSDLAEIVLTHPLASDSLFAPAASLGPSSNILGRLVQRWRLANAISASDLVAVLKNIADNPPSHLPKGLGALFRAEINAMLAKPSPLALRQASMDVSVFQGIPAPPVPSSVGVTQTALGNLDVLFNKMLDRVSQRFTMWMRVWTIAFSFIIAIAGCLDAIDLANKLLNNSALRAQLVNAAPQITQIAERTQGTIETDALKQAAKEAGLAATPPGVASAQAADEWIDNNVKDPTQNALVKSKFEADLKTVIRARGQDAQTIATTLASAGFLKFDWSGWQSHEGDDPWTPVRKALGVLVSGLLLSLGAPFWYNTLKSLVSLRPLLAGKQAVSEEKAK